MTAGNQTEASLPRPAVGTSHLLATGEVVTNYFVSGSGETVVLLPAFGRSVSDYNEFVESLNEAGYRTVAIQPRGVGQSTSPVFPRAGLQDFAQDVANVVRSLDELEGGKVHLIGRAFGARVVRMFATRYPDLAQSVVLLAGGGAVRFSGARLIRYILCNCRCIPRRWRIRATKRTLYAPGNQPPEHLVYRHTFRAARRQFSALRTPLDDVWQDGKTPVLWIHGQQDILVPLGIAVALRDRFPDQVTLTVIPNAGHALLPEQPGRVLQEVLGFLREHALSGNAV